MFPYVKHVLCGRILISKQNFALWTPYNRDGQPETTWYDLPTPKSVKKKNYFAFWKKYVHLHKYKFLNYNYNFRFYHYVLGIDYLLLMLGWYLLILYI
jgi:hypothetical protein